MNFFRIVLIVISFFVSFGVAMAHGGTPVLSVDAGVGEYDLRMHVDVLLDEGYGVQQVASPEFADRFTPAGGAFVPGTSHDGYWLRFAARVDDESISSRWFFKVVPPQNKIVVFYAKDRTTGAWVPWHAGYGNENRTTWKGELFLARELVLSKTADVFYIYVQSEDAFFSPLLLAHENVFYSERSIETFFLASSFGFALCLAVYNFFLFFIVKDVSYLWYFLQCVSLVTYFILVRGIVFQFMDFDSSFIAKFTFVFLVFYHFFSSLFVKCFFAKRIRHSAVSLVLRFLPLFPGLLLVAMALAPVPVVSDVVSVLNVAYPTLYLFIGVWAWKTGFSHARYFVLAWGVLVVAAVLTGIGGLGGVRSMEQLLSMLQAASLLEMLLLSLALADRIAAIRRDRYVADALHCAREAFLGRVRGDVRAALGVIESAVRAVLDSNTEGRVQKQLAVVLRSSSHLSDVVGAPLDDEGTNPGEGSAGVGVFRLRELLDGVAALVEPLRRSDDVLFSIHVDDALPDVVEGDSKKVMQVLLNLLGNAMSQTRQGRVRLDAALREGGVVRFSVSDTGPGIAPQDRARLFERFAQAGAEPDRRGGAGLGLAIARQLTEEMGGTIGFESAEGHGSCFAVDLPLCPHSWGEAPVSSGVLEGPLLPAVTCWERRSESD